MAFGKIVRATTLLGNGWAAFNTLIDDLLSVVNGKGASQIGVEDTAGNMSAVNVEDALAEIYSDHSSVVILSATFNEDPSTTSALTWGYQTGLIRLGVAVTEVSAGTIGLTDDDVNYVELDPADSTVKKNTTSFTAGRIPLREITTASGIQTVSTDKRAWFTQVAASSVTVQGIVELATDAETVTGTDTARATTPASLTARLEALLEAPGEIGGTTPGTVNATTVNMDIIDADGTDISAAELAYVDNLGENIQTRFNGLGTASVKNHGTANGEIRLNADAAAGDAVLVAGIDEWDTDATAYEKQVEFIINHPGEYRIKFSLKKGSGTTAYGRIYKNGSPVGTEQSTSSTSYVVFSEDISSWAAEDLCQIYVKSSTFEEDVYLTNVRINTDYSRGAVLVWEL